MKIILFFIMVCLLIGGQILGAKFQIKSFNEALKRLHKKGNEEAQDEYSGYIEALDALEEKLAEQIAGEEVKG